MSVGEGEDGVRLDRWLRRRWPHLGQSQIHKLARSGQIRVDGGRVKAETRLAAGSLVLTERTDRFGKEGNWIELPVAGVFEVIDGRITLWRDYFDMTTFTDQLTALAG